MNTIIVYKSRYGHTKEYANWIGEELGITPKDLKIVKEEDFKNADTIIYGCGLYAGSLHIPNELKNLANKNIIIFTTGLADPKKTDFTSVIEANIPKPLADNAKIFHFISGMDYPNLSFIHKMMMKMVKSKFENAPAESRGRNYDKFINQYFDNFKNSDRTEINELTEYVKNLK